LNTGCSRSLLYGEMCALATQTLTPLVDKDSPMIKARCCVCKKLLSALWLEPERQRLLCAPPEGHKSFLVAFADNAEESIVVGKIFEVQANRLCDACSGRIKKFEQRSVAPRKRIIVGDTVEE